MDLRHRLVRQAIHIAVKKAMGDMKSNTGRSVRNLIDLGLMFSQSENQKIFFDTAQKVVSHPKNPYYRLVSRALADIDHETIKTVGLNLGYNSMIYGAHKLKKKQETTAVSLPWLLIFDISRDFPNDIPAMETLIEEGRELGIYSYIFRLPDIVHIPMLCAIAKRFEECLFIFQTSAAMITEQSSLFLAETHNTVVSVQIGDGDADREVCINAFQNLKQNRCLYGFHQYYHEGNVDKITSGEYIRWVIGLGSLFGVYIADHDVSEGCKESAYAFACQTRGEKGQPLITLEWSYDMRYISDKILAGDGFMAISPCQKVKETFTKSLLELIQIIQPVQANSPCT